MLHLDLVWPKFGYIKGHFTGTRPIESALQTMLIGGLAAGAAFLIASWIG